MTTIIIDSASIGHLAKGIIISLGAMAVWVLVIFALWELYCLNEDERRKLAKRTGWGARLGKVWQNTLQVVYAIAGIMATITVIGVCVVQLGIMS